MFVDGQSTGLLLDHGQGQRKRGRVYRKPMYELYIANKNYSSWSLRAWVLMRELEIAFREHLVPITYWARAPCANGMPARSRKRCGINRTMTKYLGSAGCWKICGRSE